MTDQFKFSRKDLQKRYPGWFEKLIVQFFVHTLLTFPLEESVCSF